LRAIRRINNPYFRLHGSVIVPDKRFLSGYLYIAETQTTIGRNRKLMRFCRPHVQHLNTDSFIFSPRRPPSHAVHAFFRYRRLGVIQGHIAKHLNAFGSNQGKPLKPRVYSIQGKNLTIRPPQIGLCRVQLSILELIAYALENEVVFGIIESPRSVFCR